MNLPDFILPQLHDWELAWAPYDVCTYQFVLDRIRPSDVVLDIGAGDLRLARQMVDIVERVFAIEIQSDLINRSRSFEGGFPDNLFILFGDARELPFPYGVTVGVLLMRHCSHFQLYAEKLLHVGCHHLITNARWGMGVEDIDLRAPRIYYQDLRMGWFACWCGAVGFKEGPVELVDEKTNRLTNEVIQCPKCTKQK